MDIVDKEIRSFLIDKYTPLQPMLQPLREKAEAGLVPIIMRDTESLLGMLLRLYQPRKILEIGTAIGYSAMFFALACPKAQVYTIEADLRVQQTACRNIEKAGLAERIHCLQGDGGEEAQRLAEEGVTDFDLIFLDAGKSHYMRFLNSVLPVIADKALILADNILIHGMTVSEEADPRRKHLTNVRGMREYIDFVTSDERMTTTLLPVGDGLAVSEFRRYG